VRKLQNDARKTNRDIAEAVNVAASTSLERIRSLLPRGAIRGALHRAPGHRARFGNNRERPRKRTAS